MFVPVFLDQELCGETPCLPCEELGAGERQTDPAEDSKGERCGGRGGGFATSVL